MNERIENLLMDDWLNKLSLWLGVVGSLFFGTLAFFTEIPKFFWILFIISWLHHLILAIDVHEGAAEKERKLKQRKRKRK